jgi:hypothetical protein
VRCVFRAGVIVKFTRSGQLPRSINVYWPDLPPVPVSNQFDYQTDHWASSQAWQIILGEYRFLLLQIVQILVLLNTACLRVTSLDSPTGNFNSRQLRSLNMFIVPQRSLLHVVDQLFDVKYVDSCRSIVSQSIQIYIFTASSVRGYSITIFP